jgi:Nif-specific regulatory protein
MYISHNKISCYMDAFCKKSGDECYGIKELTLLFEISNLLNKNYTDIRLLLSPIIDLLSNYLKSDRTILTILNRANFKISIELASGLTEKEMEKGLYDVGEGIIGKVVETGKSIVIPDILDHDGFLNKTGAPTRINDQQVSFICIPIKDENNIIGTLSINKVYNRHLSFAEDERILSIIGTMIVQAVRNRQEYLEEIERLREENSKLHAELIERINPANIIGNSSKMQLVFDLINMVAPTDATVIIRGESGVGKELIADAIHYKSQRKNQSLIKVNCAALPENLIESELFGHKRGAFTDAKEARIGRFEAANGGTIFLDEIGDLPLPTQIKLLRVLQSHEIEKIGSSDSIQIDVRIICATNRNLEELIEKELFREDFYYRVNGFPIFVPPLRERIDDLPGLIDHFILKINKKHGKNIKRISSSAIDMLMVYHWPGNIRELENCIERACILSKDGVIRAINLPPTLQTASSSHTKHRGTLDHAIAGVEKQMLLDALVSSKGNLVKAAEILGITERMMGIRIKKHSIDPSRFKSGSDKHVKNAK